MLNCVLHCATLAAQVKYFCYRKSDFMFIVLALLQQQQICIFYL